MYKRMATGDWTMCPNGGGRGLGLESDRDTGSKTLVRPLISLVQIVGMRLFDVSSPFLYINR